MINEKVEGLYMMDVEKRNEKKTFQYILHEFVSLHD